MLTCRPLRFALASMALGLCVALPPASAATYRCDVDGRTLYADRPCDRGRESRVADAQAPTAADRASANARARADRAALVALDEARRRDERHDAAASTRRDVDRRRRLEACTRMTLRARRAREDVETAGPRDQAKARVHARRADEDRAVRCAQS